VGVKMEISITVLMMMAQEQLLLEIAEAFQRLKKHGPKRSILFYM
jgi:hypothetical protein